MPGKSVLLQDLCCRLICQELTYLTLFRLESSPRKVKYYTEVSIPSCSGKWKKNNWATFSGQPGLDLPTLAPKST